LNERFVSVGRHLRRSRPFPSFLEACDELTLEELTMGGPTPSPPTALVVSTGSSSSSPRPAPQQTSGHPTTNPGGGKGGGLWWQKQSSRRSGPRWQRWPQGWQRRWRGYICCTQPWTEWVLAHPLQPMAHCPRAA
jgi:hypothetical protein